ncbi:hypothetical protein JCM10212_003810 [Sporobolomyces blumeae]
MSVTPPTSQIASRPIDMAVSQSPPPTSALSASLKAFSDLSLANRPPVRLESDEFQQAYHHARRASFGNNVSGSAPPRPHALLTDDSGTSTAGLSRSIPTLSTSPGSNTSDLSSLPTPSSSPLTSPAIGSTSAALTSHASAPVGKRSGSTGATSGKTTAVPILGGVCEKEEILMEQGELPFDDEVDLPASAPQHHHSRSFSNTDRSSLFGGGARWGFTSSGAGTHSPPALEHLPLRRGSQAFTSPPGSSIIPLPSSSVSSSSTIMSPPLASTSTVAAKSSPPLLPISDPFARMQPLGRVVSAGAALQTPQDKGGSSDGFGLFRRFSIGGFGSKKRPSPPSPPSLALPPQTSSTLTSRDLSSSHFSAPSSSTSSPNPSMATSSSPSMSQSNARGRSLTVGTGAAGSAKPKRKLSPMGEKILRGGY